MVGIVEEQHGDRARLFHQWQELDGPVFVDSLNLLGVTVVPLHLLVLPDGTIHAIARDPDQVFGFLEMGGTVGVAPEAPAPDLGALEQHVRSLEDATKKEPAEGAVDGSEGGDAGGAGDGGEAATEEESQRARAALRRIASRAWRDLGDARFLWGTLDGAVEAYGRAASFDAGDAVTRFRRGVVLRRRSETDARQPDDFRNAVTAWTDALERNPENYIWRRRIQQYGPQLAKPYPFYDWVEQARADILARGETPVELSARLTDSERLGPAATAEIGGGPGEENGTDPSAAAVIPHPDPEGKLPRDETGMVAIETAFAPARTTPGAPVRLHVVCRPDATRAVKWGNEVGPLQVRIEVPEGWAIEPAAKLAPMPGTPESTEVRTLEFEVTPPASAPSGKTTLEGAAYYPVCEGDSGTCIYLRHPFTFDLTLTPSSEQDSRP